MAVRDGPRRPRRRPGPAVQTGHAIVPAPAPAPAPGAHTTEAPMAEKITVMNPVGFAPKVTRKELAPRLATLEDKTIYLVDCRFDDSDIFLRQMEGWFRDHMPGVRTVVKPISSVYLNDDPATWEEIKARG